MRSDLLPRSKTNMYGQVAFQRSNSEQNYGSGSQRSVTFCTVKSPYLYGITGSHLSIIIQYDNIKYMNASFLSCGLHCPSHDPEFHHIHDLRKPLPASCSHHVLGNGLCNICNPVYPYKANTNTPSMCLIISNWNRT